MTNRFKNFTEDELACPHCLSRGVTDEAGKLLQTLREELDRPLRINSAYRCPIHNEAVGGVSGSKHLLGTAFDVSTRAKDWTVADKARLYEVAKSVGFKGFGHYRTFLHIDTGPEREW